MQKRITLCLIVIVAGFLSHAQLIVPYIAAPTIDGLTDGDAWSDTWINQALGKVGNSTSAMSSKFQIGHDNDNIYLIVQIQDATPNNNEGNIPNSYDRDCIEVFFSMHSVTEDATYTDGDWQIRCQRAGANLVDGSGNAADEFAAGNFAFEVNNEVAGQYTIEASFSKATLAEESDFDDVNFRFDIQTADNTTGASGGRTQQQFWFNNSDTQWNNVNTFGAAKMGVSTQTFPVTFTITDGDLNPIEGATIELTGYGSKTTNNAGKATYSWIEPATDIAYTVTKSGYKLYAGTISVANSAVDVNVAMSLKTFPVTFTLTDEGLLPIEGAKIELTGYNPQLTNNTGKAIFETVNPAENIDYTVTKKGYNVTTGTISVFEGEVYENIALTLITFPVNFSITDQNLVPIKGASIELTGYNAHITDINGKTKFAKVIPANNMTYTVTKTGYKISTGTISVINSVVNFNIALTKTPSPVTFAVYDENSTPIEDASVELAGYNSQTTNNTGQAIFETVFPAESINYTITKTGYYVLTGSISVTDTAVYQSFALTLITFPVTFTITDGNLNPLEEVTIELMGYNPKTTNNSGKVTFSLIEPASDIAYTVTKAGYKLYTGTISVANSAVDVNVAMSLKTFPVTFTLTDEGLLPIEGAKIELTGYNPQLTNNTGKAIFENVNPAENIEYTVTKKGYNVTTGTISLFDSAVYQNIALTLITFPVTFTLIDENSFPIEGATIELIGYDSQLSTNTGKALFSRVLPVGDIDYAITKTGFNTAEGTISVTTAAIFKSIAMSLSTPISGFNEDYVPSFEIYPNPASKEFLISSTQNIESLVILNLQGQVVYKFNGKPTKNTKYQINVTGFPKGVYLVKADSFLERIIIE